MQDIQNQPTDNKSFYIWTVGCQMNVADSNYVAAALRKRGYDEAPEHRAGRRGRAQLLRSAPAGRRPHRGQAGRASSAQEEARPTSSSPSPAAWSPKTRPPCAAASRWSTSSSSPRPSTTSLSACPTTPRPTSANTALSLALEGLLPTAQAGGIASYIPIIYGCNKTCTYCIVPFRRGKERSRTIEDIAREVEYLDHPGRARSHPARPERRHLRPRPPASAPISPPC